MIWVFVFGGVALLGLVTMISYAVWLAHKAGDLYSEVRMVGRRATEAGDLLASVKLPQSSVTRASSESAVLRQDVPWAR